CTPCSVGQYKDWVGGDECSPCPYWRSTTSSAGASTCICQRGYYGTHGADCTMCNATSYKDWIGMGLCTACPGGSGDDQPG
ncbi:hypothetical protein T484DRAFT_1575868, partial [Baffinella frigidus]